MCNYDNVKNRSYYKSINNSFSSSFDNWIESEIEEKIEDKIQEEAYLQSLNKHNDDLGDYFHAKQNIEERLRLIAYYMHDKNYNKSATNIWKEAKKLYIENF